MTITTPNAENEKALSSSHFEEIYSQIAMYLQSAREKAVRSINTTMVQTYWLIGKIIVEEELKGQERATYGQELMESLSKRLTNDFGKGFTATNIRYMRLFYLTYQHNQIHHAVRDESIEALPFNANLSWTHYRILTKVQNAQALSFYEVEALKNNWSARELERQINSLLFERLAKSKDKEGLLRLAYKGQEIQRPQDIIKDPVVLEFLDLPESHRLVESELEEALTSNLQQFLLELGKGFAFVSRQQRLTLDGDHFYVDLVFYHTILKCYILIDIKTHKLTHADLGQIQLYVNYYDKEQRTEGDNPTLGLILCTEKNNEMVKYALGDRGEQIFASKYQFHLPTEEELKAELNRELKYITSTLSNERSD